MAEQEGKTEAQQFFENFTVAQDSGATSSQQVSNAQGHVYDYLHAREQYGGNRYLRTPDGQYERAHYSYQRHTPRSHSHTRQYRHSGRRVESQNWARPYGQVRHTEDASASAQGGRRGFLAEYSAWFFGLLGLS